MIRSLTFRASLALSFATLVVLLCFDRLSQATRSAAAPAVSEERVVPGQQLRVGSSASPAATAVLQDSRAVLPSTLSDRNQIKLAAAAAVRPRTRVELTAFLAGLEATARASGRVSALEVEPGLSAARAFEGEQQLGGELSHSFSERMARLSAELEGRPYQPTIAGLPAVSERLERSDDPAEQRLLVRDYLTAVALRPPEERAALMARLTELTAP